MKYSPSDYAGILYETKDIEGLLTLLKKHWVLPWLPKILEEYKVLFQKAERIVKAVVKTRFSLSKGKKEVLYAILKQAHKEKKIELDFVVDKDTLGGFQVEADEFLIKASLQDKLNDLFLGIR